mgnify:CR=1 FL=1
MIATSLVFGSGRFASLVCNNTNEAVIGGYDIPTKLVGANKDVALCLPPNLGSWGLYPTHQEAWLSLSFVLACHGMHRDETGLTVRQTAWEHIPEYQWAVLAAQAFEFTNEFRTRLADANLSACKAYKSATRALQDCLLYLVEKEFPEDQDTFLAASPIRHLIEQANQGRAGSLTLAEGLALADAIDALVNQFVGEYGGLEACQEALVALQAEAKPGRVIVLPETIGLTKAIEMLAFDVIIGTPDAHDIDVVSILPGWHRVPELVQLKDRLSEQRLDIMCVGSDLGANEYLAGGHPAFQSVAEMLLANGTTVSKAGQTLVDRLTTEIDPQALAAKYRETARWFFSGDQPKSWLGRKNAAVLQIKKVIPLYRIACDLIPRAVYMEQTGQFPGGQDIAQLAEATGLGDVYHAIRAIMNRQDASDEELQAIADQIEAVMVK